MPVAVVLFVCLGTALGSGGRIARNINRDWTFQYFPDERSDARRAAPGYDDRRWPAIALPHTWSTYETTGDPHPFIRSASERDDSYWWYGWGWYRKRFTVGKVYEGRLVAIEFDGVQKYARVYLNGALVGEHKGGYTSFSMDVTRQVRFGAENVLAVEVSNRRDDPFGRIPPMTAGNFDVYGGIYRDVRLVIRDRLHVPFQGSADYEGGTFVTTPEVSEARGVARVRTWVRNEYPETRECTLATEVRDAQGDVVARASSRQTIEAGQTREFVQVLGPVPNPRLWSPDSPYLYRVDTAVREGGRLADTYTSPLGFRWYTWNKAERRLHLNGKPLVLRGINRHQEYPWLGDALPKWMHRKDLEDIRYNMGLYFQRTAHYPNDPYVYDECDRLGFILIEEAPNIKDIAFGRDVQRQNLREMIRRDRNHPSIFVWSIGNETNQPADSAWAAEEDPTRLIYLRRGENGGDHVQITDKDLAIENLLRCTARGWYSSDDRDFGPETRNPSSGQVTGTEAWQHETCARSGRLANDNVVVWLYADHGADREYLNSPLKHINPKGWVDLYRFPKYVYYLWQANFTSKPMAFIHPHYWREQYLGQRKDIVVDSNCDEVILKVNGEMVGKASPSDANAHAVTFPNVEIRRGAIAVEGYRGGQRVEYSLKMAGKPARLVLRASPDRIPADRSGISVISADIVDANGVHVYGANPTLQWSVDGPATLVGPREYRTDTAKNGAMEGAMYIDVPVSNVLRSKAAPGAIRVTVSAPGLAAAEVTVTAVAPAEDAVEGIVEPPLSDLGRSPVRRDPAFKTVVFAAKAGKLQEIRQDYDFKAGSREEYRRQVGDFVRRLNPGIDPFTSAYRLFIERMTSIVEQRNGHLVADDYNFNVRAFNDKSGAYRSSTSKATESEQKRK
ncbi:MAG: glycoside hydrolase family 2 TIM barrel-domain containing protein [Bryobacteraceae bacterium]